MNMFIEIQIEMKKKNDCIFCLNYNLVYVLAYKVFFFPLTINFTAIKNYSPIRCEMLDSRRD